MPTGGGRRNEIQSKTKRYNAKGITRQGIAEQGMRWPGEKVSTNDAERAREPGPIPLGIYGDVKAVAQRGVKEVVRGLEFLGFVE